MKQRGIDTKNILKDTETQLGEIKKQKTQVEEESSKLRLLHMKAVQDTSQEHSEALDKLRRDKTHENQEDNTRLQQQHQGEIRRLMQQLEADGARQNQAQNQKFTAAMDDQKRALVIERQRETHELTQRAQKASADQEVISRRQEAEIEQLKQQQNADRQKAQSYHDTMLTDIKTKIEREHSSTVSTITDKHAKAIRELQKQLDEEQRQHAVREDGEAAVIREKGELERRLKSELSDKEREVGKIQAELQTTTSLLSSAGKKSKDSELENQTNTTKLALIQRSLDQASRERDGMKAQIELEKKTGYRANESDGSTEGG